MAASIDFAQARQNMIDGQVRPNGIIDQRLVDAMAEIPRENFVPSNRRSVAYIDEDLALGDGRYLPEPVVTARLIQALDISSDDVVLEIGSGCGYATAVLARLANTVVALESSEELSARAQEVLGKLGIDNAVNISGELTEGYKEQAPFDAILIHGAVANIPDAITAQLGDDGRLATVVRPARGVGQITLVRRVHGVASSMGLFDAGTPFLLGFEPTPAFSF